MVNVSKQLTSPLPRVSSTGPVARGDTRPGPSFVEFEKEWIEQSIPDLFQRQVKANPQRTAVKTRNQTLSYLRLEEQANRIAQAILSRRGEGPESVALLLEHEAPMIAAILGILKAGKIYVPLDAHNQPTRNAFMTQAAEAELIVCDSRNQGLANQLAQQEGMTLTVLNSDEIAAGPSEESPNIRLSPDTLAYIFYTSGSTGQPKGVVDNHRNVLHNIMRYTNSLNICADDRLTLLQSCSFSGSVSNIFGALLNGAALFLYDLRRQGVDQLAHWLNGEQITIYHSVPTIFRSFLKGELNFPKLRVIRLEGDQASPEDVALYKKFFSPQCVLVNGLGTTETGLVRQYFINKESEVTGSTVPVGYTVRDMEILLLDEGGNEAEEGEIGEIAVRSKYLAVGYWRNSKLTQAKFLSDPNCIDSRTYLTGDVGRMRTDSCLEHLGRKDFQLRIKGQWVDAAEVETALKNLPFVEQAVVSAHQDNIGESKLIAYIVLEKGETAPPHSHIYRALVGVLPEYMIPSGLVFLDALPLNLNGKLDRRSLPAPPLNQTARSAAVAPRFATEKTLANIWSEVLGVSEIGIRDDFFEFGGDSLQAMQIISRIEATFGLTLEVRAIFESPSVESLAFVIDQQVAKRAEPRRPFGN